MEQLNREQRLDVQSKSALVAQYEELEQRLEQLTERRDQLSERVQSVEELKGKSMSTKKNLMNELNECRQQSKVAEYVQYSILLAI